MTTLIKWLNNPYVIGILLLTSAATDLILWGLACDLSKSDWGTWVGSIGTVGAMVGTIYLATADARKRDHEQLQVAQLHAAGILMRLGHSDAQVQSALETATLALETPIELDLHNLRDMRYRLESIRLCKTDDLVPLVVLPGQVAAKLAQATDQIEAMTTLLSKFVEHYPTLTSEERYGMTTIVREILTVTSKLLSETMTVCSEQTEKLRQAGH